MKKLILVLVLLIFLIPLRIAAFNTSATSSILMDIDSGKILYSKNIHVKRSVASISKIMTAIVAIESGKLSDIITVGEEIGDAYGSGIYIKQGEHITLEDLLYGLMLRSGNDAALAIANYVGGNVEDFVKLMNEKANLIGMNNSEFNNPSGLDQDKGNYSTAYDMALLTSYAMKNDTYKKIVGTKNHKVKTDMNYYDWTNKNKLLFSYKYITGGKTGFTEIARRTLVTTASKDNLNLVVVTLNDGNDFEDHKNLFEEAFANYKNYELLKEGILQIPGEDYYKNSELFVKETFRYPFSEQETSSIMIKYELNKLRHYNDSDEVGKARIYMNDQEIGEIPIFIKTKGQENKKWYDNIIDWLKSLW